MGAMVDLNGHEAGNGRYTQMKPMPFGTLLYSERRLFASVDYCRFAYSALASLKIGISPKRALRVDAQSRPDRFLYGQ